MTQTIWAPDRERVLAQLMNALRSKETPMCSPDDFPPYPTEGYLLEPAADQPCDPDDCGWRCWSERGGWRRSVSVGSVDGEAPCSCVHHHASEV